MTRLSDADELIVRIELPRVEVEAEAEEEEVGTEEGDAPAETPE